MGQERDQRARMQMERERFARAVGASIPQAMPLDRFGNGITPGGNVMYRPEVDLVFHVADVKPIMDPKVPPGMVGVRLTADFQLMVPFGQPLARMIAIGGQQQMPAPSGDQPATAPPPDGEAPAVPTETPVDPPPPAGDTPLVTLE